MSTRSHHGWGGAVSARWLPALLRSLTLLMLGVLAALLLVGVARAQTIIDVDEIRQSPVPHRYIHGRLGDAKFQLAMPVQWNGKLLIGARGYSGTEASAGAFKTVGLQKGYAYALSDQGWYRYDIIERPEDKYFESRRRILQLTHYSQSTVARHYGRHASRTFMVGGSNGGHNTKMMVEDYPQLYDGGVAGYGITSHLEWMASNAGFLRNFDVIASRINDIIAARQANPAWDPAAQPLSPPLSAAQIQALTNIYQMPAQVQGLPFNIGRPVGSEYRWPSPAAGWPLGQYDAILGYLMTSLEKFDRFYDPNGDGTVTEAEAKLWDPRFSPPPVANDLRRFDNTGRLVKPIIIAHGSHDPIVVPGETEAYIRLVEANLGAAGAREVLAVYYIPGMGHGGAPYDALIGPQLDALEAWVDFRESRGARGAPPPAVISSPMGSYPRR